jgi:hypothetical protein
MKMLKRILLVIVSILVYTFFGLLIVNFFSSGWLFHYLGQQAGVWAKPFGAADKVQEWIGYVFGWPLYFWLGLLGAASALVWFVAEPFVKRMRQKFQKKSK